MKSKQYPSYSEIFLLKRAFEFELSNIKISEDKSEMFDIIKYLEERIKELKEDEKKCLVIQASSKK